MNLINRQIEVYTQPSGEGAEADYLSQQDYGAGDEVRVMIGGVEVGRVTVSLLLP